MEAVIGIILNCGLPVLLVLIGLGVGTAVERSHLRDLARREAALRGIGATNLRTVPAGMRVVSSQLVSGSVVIGSDYFKTLAAGLRKIIGGELRSFERMMERARREALCRMLEDAQRLGATAVINVRYETANIGGMGPNSMPMAEVVAYGTAVFVAR